MTEFRIGGPIDRWFVDRQQDHSRRPRGRLECMYPGIDSGVINMYDSNINQPPEAGV